MAIIDSQVVGGEVQIMGTVVVGQICVKFDKPAVILQSVVLAELEGTVIDAHPAPAKSGGACDAVPGINPIFFSFRFSFRRNP